MRWEKLRRSKNVEDRRDSGGKPRGVSGGPGGCGCLILLVLIAVIFLKTQNFTGSRQAPLPSPQTEQAGAPGETNDELGEFVAAIKGSAEEEWTKIFAEHQLQYRPARMVNFSGSTPMPGGRAQSGMGPFYLPYNQTVYLDTEFFFKLKRMARDDSDFDFACAYVIAHEIAHHVQNQLGYTDKVHSQRGRVSKAVQNELSVRLELQADYLAGVWAHHANARMRETQGHNLLEEGDIEEAMRAAKAIGDDAIQRQSQGYVVPDSFTHGTSEQRLSWFVMGLRSGDATGGDTFSIPASQL